MSMKLSKAENLKFLTNLSTGLKAKKEQMDEMNEMLATPRGPEKNAEEIFVSILKEVLKKEMSYSFSSDIYMVQLEIPNFIIWGSRQKMEQMLSSAPFLYEFCGQQYDPNTLVGLFEKCGLKRENCSQAKSQVSLNFDTHNLDKARQYIDSLVESKKLELKQDTKKASI